MMAPGTILQPVRTSAGQRLHVSGMLQVADMAPLLGIHQLALQLADDDGRRHILHLVHGRSSDAAGRCLQQYEGLLIGARYHASSTIQQHDADGSVHHYGHIDIERARHPAAAANAVPGGAQEAAA